MQSIILVMAGILRTCSVLVAAATLIALPARADTTSGSFVVSLRVLPRVQTGLPGGQRAAFVAAPGAAALPCGAEGSAACASAAAAARDASGSTAPVVVTVLPDGAPTAIVER